LPKNIETLKMIQKYKLLNGYCDFFKQNNKHWDLFTITLTFKSSSSSKYIKDQCLSIYDNNFLNKIRKQLYRNYNLNQSTIPYEYFRLHEYDEKSLLKVDNEHTPNHIHGIIPIKKEYTKKFWNIETNTLTRRLQKDIKSIKKVASFLIEPIRLDELDMWISYCAKYKKVEDL